MRNRTKELEKLAEIFDCQVFELCKADDKEPTAYMIPYMMNDAAEDYLILKNGRLVGEYLTQKEAVTTAQVVTEADGYVLVVNQGNDNVFTLHFDDIQECVNYYQYHEIGHFWVKGQEHWRQLVYIIGTIYDKYEYMGEQACNEEELELLKLMEFAPFRIWSPVHESLEEKYPATYDGIDAMEMLALQAGDVSFQRWIRLYRRIPAHWMEKWLSRRLLLPKREALYQLVYEKVKSASEQYPKRNYGIRLNEEIKQKRKNIHHALISKGFCGTYPEYKKDKMAVLVTEEHPFTLMEFENFVFRVHFMVSECGKKQKSGRNCGFFKGKGRKGYILSEEEMDKL